MILQNGWFFYWNQPFPYSFCRLHLPAQPVFCGDFFYSPFYRISGIIRRARLASVSSVGVVSAVLPVSPVVPGTVVIVSLVVLRVGSVAVLTVGLTVVSVEFQISSLVGSTVGSGVVSILRFVQPQPVNMAAVRTRVNTMAKTVFIFLPPNGLGFNGIITKPIDFRQENASN